MLKQVKAAIIEHFCQPIGPLCASWRQIDFDDPRVKLLVEHNVETVNFEAVLLLL